MPRCAQAAPPAQRLRRTLAETSAEVAGFRKTFQEFLTAPEEDWEVRVPAVSSSGSSSNNSSECVESLRRVCLRRVSLQSLAGVRRAQLTQHFFEYLQLRISAMDPQTQAQEREGARPREWSPRLAPHPPARSRRPGHRRRAPAGAGGDA